MSIPTGVISYPTPPFQNLAIEPEFYQPSRFIISAITLGQTTLVTTTENNNFVIGQQVRLLIPANWGSYQLNNLTGYVLSIPQDNQVEISINSIRNVNAFVVGSGICQAQIIAVGDINQGNINNNGPLFEDIGIPGAFENISPLRG